MNKNKIIINPGEVKTVIGKGFAFFDNNNQRGNLHIKFNVLFPLNLKVEQKKIIKNVFEGNYIQYIKNMNTTAEKKLINNIALNKNNFKKNISDNKTNTNNYKPIKKTKFIPKFNLKKEINNQNEKNKIKKSNNNFRSQSELNKSFNKKSQINNTNQNEKEKEKEIKKLEIYELVKFDETLVNKSYFYQKSN